MKLRLLLLTIGVSFAALTANATTHTIQVRDFVFAPNTLSINLGDTVLFTWVDGDHTTTSATIPGGAMAWDHPINSNNTSFTYVPAVAGVYNYVCTPHASMNMIGSFTVVNPSGIAEHELSKAVFDLYPSPAKEVLNIAVKNGIAPSQISLLDVTGREIMIKNNLRSEQVQMDISTLTEGLYFARVIQDGKAYVRKFMVAR